MRVLTFKSHSKRQGFTLIELLVVMAVLGILAAAALPLSQAWVTSRKEQQLKTALSDIRLAIDRYKAMADQGLIVLPAGSSGFPATLNTLVQGSPQAAKDGQTQEGNTQVGNMQVGNAPPVATAAASGAKHYFLRSLPRDPFADPSLPADKTWGLRSYASPPDKPMPGDDVYDVYSMSQAQALDGSYYRTW